MIERTSLTRLAFCDIESTGLYPHLGHEVWEVYLVVRTLPDAEGKAPPDVERHWFLPVDLGRADPVALTIGGFYERAPGYRSRAKQATEDGSWSDPADFARTFATLTHGAQLVGAVPSFDASFLAPLLRKHGGCPGWNYHLIDVEQLAWGWLHGRRAQASKSVAGPLSSAELRALDAAIKAIGLPFESEELSRACGVDPERFPKHTAEGDVRWAMALYDAVVGS